jgi:hypothetical protein
VTADEVHEATGFELLVAESVRMLDPPSDDELRELRWLKSGVEEGAATREGAGARP